MTELAEKLLSLIAEKYLETGKTDMLIVQFDFDDRDFRDEIGNELIAEGYLSKFDTFGRTDFRCDITPMMVDMIEKNKADEVTDETADEVCQEETELSEILNEESDPETVEDVVSSSETDDPKKKKKTISIIVALLLVAMLIFLMIPRKTKLDRVVHEVYETLGFTSMATGATDLNTVLSYTRDENGRVDSIKIDTNPLDHSTELVEYLSQMSEGELFLVALSNYDAPTANAWQLAYSDMPLSLDAIKMVNEELGFGSAVYELMMQTSSLMGRQTQENSKYCVSWTYHPNRGLEIMYYEK